MAIGRPLSLTPNVATKNISADATANQTEFTVTGGYRINEIAVYRNGVRLAQGRDFTASDGSTVNLVNGATINDVIEFSIFDSFNIADAIVSAASSQNVNGDLNVTGKLYGGTVDTDSLKIGVGTFASAIHVGTALTADASGNFNTVGMITAASFSGSGANLTGVASTDNIITGTAATFRNTAVSAGVPNVNIVGLATVGIITAYGAAELSSTVAVGGVVTLTDTTDATSTSTGALIISGGVGIAKSLHVGQNISVGGTLTYEDVTNVDSIGLVTARSGVNVSGGQLLVGSGITMGIAGVATFSGTGDVHLLDDVKLLVGDGSDLQLYHDGDNSYIDDGGGTGSLIYKSNVHSFRNSGNGADLAKFTETGSVDLYHNGSKKFETSATGATITGEVTASLGLIVGSGLTIGSAGIATFANGSATTNGLHFGTDGDLKLYHNGSNAHIKNGTGNLTIDCTDADLLLQAKAGENSVYCVADGAVNLYHDNVKTFETIGNGVLVQGTEGADGHIYIYADEGDENADKWRVKADTSGVFGVDSYASASWSNKLSLTSAGALTATSFIGDGSALSGIGGDMDITSSLFV